MNMNLLIPENRNLVSYYMLPLVRVNVDTFGSKFVNAYINKDGTQIFVELSTEMNSPNYELSPHYTSTMDVYGTVIVSFKVPESHLNDVHLFKSGAYSQMSKEAKKIIYKTSGLAYNEKMENFSISHPILHALGTTKRLREYLFTYLDVEELADSGELIDPPSEDWYIEHRIGVLSVPIKLS